MADFTEVTRRMEEFGMGSPSSKVSFPFRPAPIITEDPRFAQRTYSMSSNTSDITTPSNSGKSTPVSARMSKTRSMEEVFLMESPSASVDATASPMSRRATPPTSPYVSQRDMHPLTRKITGELGIASEVSKMIEKADFSDDDESGSEDGEEDDVIVLTDGEDNHHNLNTSLLLDSSFDISPKRGGSRGGSAESSNNSSFNDPPTSANSHHHDDDDEPFEFLKADH